MPGICDEVLTDITYVRAYVCTCLQSRSEVFHRITTHSSVSHSECVTCLVVVNERANVCTCLPVVCVQCIPTGVMSDVITSANIKTTYASSPARHIIRLDILPPLCIFNWSSHCAHALHLRPCRTGTVPILGQKVWALLCFILNIFIPGSGSIVAGETSRSCPSRTSMHYKRAHVALRQFSLPSDHGLDDELAGTLFVHT